MKLLVLDEDYREYCQLLSAAGVAADGGDDPHSCDGDYEVLLAQPELAAAYLGRGGQVAWIQSTWAGVDKLAPIARGHELQVTGVKGIFGQQMAEYVFAFLLGQSRSLAYFRQQQVEELWSPRRPTPLAGSTMLVLGTGTIGSHIAGVARALGMRTRGVSRSGTAVSQFDKVWTMDELTAAAETVDVLVNTLPSTEQTRGLIDQALLAQLAESATVFNVGRGDALCEDSLQQWLQVRPTASAVLDVFSSEPLAQGHWMWQHPRVHVTPHVAAVSLPADVTAIFLDNLERYRRGEDLRFLINLAQGY